MARPATGQVTERAGKHGRTFALRFRANGQRRFRTLGTSEEGWTLARAEVELENTLADVRRGIWRDPEPAPIVEAQREEPTFHQFASEWVEGRRGEVEPRTVEHWEWSLSCHLLPFFAAMRLSEITVELVDRYKTAKVRERDEWLSHSDKRRKELGLHKPLSNSSINKTLKTLAQVLEPAVEYGHLQSNPAAGKRRRLKTSKPRRTWLELDEIRSLLAAAEGSRRALLATMILSGLRVSEATALRWRAVDLANGKLVVEESKTDAGEGRKIDLSPMLLDELKLHKADSRYANPDDLVFPTSKGTEQHRANVGNRILGGAIDAANKTREEAGLPKMQDGITNHTMRRTFASLLYEAGASPAEVMDQMGHTSSALALEVYARKMERNRETGARMDALINGIVWAPVGTGHKQRKV